MLTVFHTLFGFELRLLLRRSQEWLYALGFFVMVVSLFPLAISPDPLLLKKILPGCLWIAALLASLLSMENLFFSDIEEGYLEQLLLSPHPLAWLILAKLCAYWLATELPLILLTPFLGMLFHLSAPAIGVLFLSLLLGTPILVLMGGLGMSLILGLRQQGVLLSLLILPMLIPVLIFGVSAVTQTVAGFSPLGPLLFLAALLVLAISFLPWTISAALRVGVEN